MTRAPRAIVRPMRRFSPSIAFAGLVFVLAACGDDAPPPPRDPIPSPDPSLSAEPAPAGSESASGSGAASAGAAADAGADGGAALAAVAGEWEGAYDARKGHVGMPDGVADPARASDDGKLASGPGAVKLTIRPSGEVTGKSQGALGPATIRGQVDGKMLRASFVPDDPTSPRAMTGVLVGILKPGVIAAELRVAGPDALLVRQANFDLKKKE